MLRRFVALCLLGVGAIAVAESPIDCVDPDFATALLSFPHASDASGFSRSIPEDLSIPGTASLSVIGSRSLGGSVVAAYRATGEVAAAAANIESKAKEEGWASLFDYRQLSGNQGGFRSSKSSKPTSWLQLCHDDHGIVSVMLGDRSAGGAYVRYVINDYPHFGGCEKQNMMAMMPKLPELPTLDIPEGVEVLEEGMNSGGSFARETATVLKSNDHSRATLIHDFDSQIRAQSLVPEGSWSGAVTSGSVWLSSDRERSVTLIVTEQAPGTFRAVLASRLIQGSRRQGVIGIAGG